MNEGKINLEQDKKNKLIQNIRFAIQEMPKKERVQGITEILSESFSEV